MGLPILHTLCPVASVDVNGRAIHCTVQQNSQY